MNIVAHIRDENKRPSKKLIPPRSTALIPVGNWVGHVYSSPTLVRQCLLVVHLPYSYNEPIWLFNGGIENQWVEDGDVIAIAT